MKILNILSSINGEKSNSNKLVRTINENMLNLHPDSVITVRDLSQNPLPHLDAAHLTAFGLPSDALSEDHQATVLHSDSAIAEVKQAHAIVIAVPFYNFTIPGTLKTWIDQIIRANVTFEYTQNGPKGLLSGKKVYLAIASGGIYSDGAMKGYDFAEPYLRLVLGFIGLTDVTTFRFEGTKIPGVLEHAYDKAAAQVGEHAF